tara:strand:+ start:1229 stop:1999 length:771 start_codon:yes stop_codon:yes gene_type:complete
MKIKKLLTLGCSINPKEGWSKCAFNHLKEKVGVLNINDWTQYGYGGGGNQILLDLLNEYFCKNSYNDTLVIFQVTDISRISMVMDHAEIIDHGLEHSLQPDLEEGFHGSAHKCWFGFNSVFSGRRQIGIYNRNNPIIKKFIYESKKSKKKMRLFHNQYMLISQMTNILKMLSYTPAEVIVFKGWSGCIRDHKSVTLNSVFEEQIKSSKVHYIDKPNVDWCLKKGLEMESDGFHPAFTSHWQYCEKFINPIIDKIIS